MNLLKARTTIECDTCGCSLKRIKTIKVVAMTKEEAIAEAKEKAAAWQRSLVGQNCKICESILAMV